MVLMAITFVTGMSTGFALSYRLLYVLGLTLILSFLWNWVTTRSLDVTVDRRTPRVRVGDNVEERITVDNLSALPKSTLEVEDLTDLPGYTSGMALTLTSKGSRSWRTASPARKRGVYTMGPVRVSNTDAFRLFRREREFCGTEQLVVLPRTFDVSSFSASARYLAGESFAKERTHDLTPHAASVREYAPGDSISRVHWNSTARLGKLMSKEFDLGRSSDVWLFVDLHTDVQAGELEESTDEYAVSIAASLAKHFLESLLPVGLIAYGDQRYFLQSETGTGQYDRIMEFLAMSKAEGLHPLSDALALDELFWSYHSALIVVTSSHRTEWVNALRVLARRRVRITVILLDARSFGGIYDTMNVLPELITAGIPHYVVRQGDNLPRALSRMSVGYEADVARLREQVEAED